jgi:hypothetical protein
VSSKINYLETFLLFHGIEKCLFFIDYIPGNNNFPQVAIDGFEFLLGVPGNYS